MQIDLKSLLDTEKNNSCVIVGPGPQLDKFNFKDFRGKIICIGDAAIRGKGIYKADYWVASNDHFPVPNIKKHLNTINEFINTTFFIAESTLYGNLWDKDQLSLNSIKPKYVFFDERHFQNKDCNPKKKCCDVKSSYNNNTLQEIISTKFGYQNHPGLAGTVFEHALGVAMYLGFNKIFVTGVDLPFSSDLVKVKSKTSYFSDFYRYLKYKYIIGFFNNKKLDTFSYHDISVAEGDGQKYYKNITLKAYCQIYEIFIITQIHLFIKIYKKNLLLNIIKKIFFLFFRKKKCKNYGFEPTKKIIIKNLNIYSNICKMYNIELYYLGHKSNLKLIKGFKEL